MTSCLLQQQQQQQELFYRALTRRQHISSLARRLAISIDLTVRKLASCRVRRSSMPTHPDDGRRRRTLARYNYVSTRPCMAGLWHLVQAGGLSPPPLLSLSAHASSCMELSSVDHEFLHNVDIASFFG